MASDLSREDRNLLCARLNEQIAEDFTPAEAEEITQAVAVANAEFERREGIPAEQFYKEMGL
jgi:hypothetical protein